MNSSAKNALERMTGIEKVVAAEEALSKRDLIDAHRILTSFSSIEHQKYCMIIFADRLSRGVDDNFPNPSIMENADGSISSVSYSDVTILGNGTVQLNGRNVVPDKVGFIQKFKTFFSGTQSTSRIAS